jgi:outer membrane protein assembly factor BamB/HEAT repeat protein
MKIRALVILVMCLTGLALGRSVAGDGVTRWPAWRGDGSGISRAERVPEAWSRSSNVLWRSALPGEGSSSPIVWDERVFVTASTDGGSNRLVLCLSAKDGTERWRRTLATPKVPVTEAKSGYAPSTPATDGERVYVFFDSPGLVCLDAASGDIRWQLPLGPFQTPYNIASSPILYSNMVLMCCDHNGDAFLLAADARSGEIRWKTPRKQGQQYGSPLVIEAHGQPQVVINGATVQSYDPRDGRELWSCNGLNPVVAPSPAWDGQRVCATSGRNGPALWIDPSGTGDVTETHVRMRVGSGGPYVPSPLALPDLLLPGDNGHLRLLGADGRQRAELRLRDHFTASPVYAGGRIYWSAESGKTYVVRVTAPAGASAALALEGVNDLAEKCLASPAITAERFFLRTTQALYCLTGTGGAALPVAQGAGEKESLDALQKRYEAHPAEAGDDVAVRLDVIERLAASADPAAIPLLTNAALNDPHWDVGEAAAKALAGFGRPAIPALISLLAAKEWQPYLKIMAAEALGQLAAAEATTPLLKEAGNRNVLVRAPALQALGRIAATNAAEAGNILPVLISGLADREGAVRVAAIEALGRNVSAVAPGAARDALLQKLTEAAADRNPLVAQAAATARKALASASRDGGVTNAPSADTPRKTSVARWLRAGPVRVKFQDGELRYFQAGNREIVRRIYFAVRDERYDTVMPEFREIAVDAAADSFTIRLAAICSNELAGFSWAGTITGTADGKIVFQVSGQAERDCKPPRIGLNVLYGAEALADQSYELISEAGTVTNGIFPRLVSPRSLSENFRTLRYRTTDGMQVSVGLADGKFGMEDQRNFGDSSYKAYSGMAFEYKNVKKGEKGAQTLTLEVKGAPAAVADSAAKPLRVTLGGAMTGAHLPKIVASSGKGVGFHEINGNQAKLAAASELAWGFNVALHLPDDDTLLENIPAVVDQVQAARAFAPRARIRIQPVTFFSPYPRPGPDPRCGVAFGAAWVVRMVNSLAQAGVAETGFDVGAGTADGMVRELAKYAGRPLLSTSFADSQLPRTIDVLAIEVDGKRQSWVVNLTDQRQSMTLAGLGNGDLALDLEAYEVCRVVGK